MSMYKFLKDSSKSGSSSGGRLFLQGATSDQSKIGPPIVTDLSAHETDDLKAVYTRKRLSTEVLGSSFESTKTSKFGEDGRRRITTKIIRKVTTLTRGEEQSREEDLTKRAQVKSIGNAFDAASTTRTSTAQPKRVKVRSLSFTQ